MCIDRQCPYCIYIYSPTSLDGDSEGVPIKTDGDRDTTSSLGAHRMTQLSSVIRACPSLHS